MILRPRKTKANLWPDVILFCDAPGCDVRELFPHNTDCRTISHWNKRHGWSVAYKGHGKFHHRCPICERLAKAPASYFDRIAS